MEEKSQAFVDAATQIIPVLVLALLADPVNRRTRPGHSGLILSALLAGVLGEFVALLGVALGTDAGANKFIGACMAVLAVAILYPHATAHFGNLRRLVPPKLRLLLGGVPYPVLSLTFLVTSGGELERWLLIVAWTFFVITFVADVLRIRHDWRALNNTEAGTSADQGGAREVGPGFNEHTDDPSLTAAKTSTFGTSGPKQSGEE
ncbi:hypothetical protein [Pedococcus sp. P5_B7]